MKKIVLLIASFILVIPFSGLSQSDFTLDFGDPTTYESYEGGYISGGKFIVKGVTGTIYLPILQEIENGDATYNFQINVTGNVTASDWIQVSYTYDDINWTVIATYYGGGSNSVQNISQVIPVTEGSGFRIKIVAYSSDPTHKWEIRTGDYTVSDVNPTPNLPVELVDFSGVAKDQAIDLEWEIASASNFSHFEILKLNEKGNYDVIGTVRGEAQYNASVSFDYQDNTPVVGENIYVLKTVDLDGTYELSAPISVKYANTISDFNIVNNGQTLSLKLTAEKSDNYQVMVYDLSGKAIYNVEGQLENGSNSIDIDFNHSGQNVYIVKMIAGTTVQTQKVVL